MQVDLSEWEVEYLLGYVAVQLTNYLGHYASTGLRRKEVDRMNELDVLYTKLGGRPTPKPKPYLGYVANRWNPHAD